MIARDRERARILALQVIAGLNTKAVPVAMENVKKWPRGRERARGRESPADDPRPPHPCPSGPTEAEAWLAEHPVP